MPYKDLCNKILQVVLAVVFIIVGLVKFGSDPKIAYMFYVIGLGSWLQYFVGLWEIVGGALLLTKTRAHIGADLVFLASIGAFIAQITVLDNQWLHTVILIILTGYIAMPHKSKILLEISKIVKRFK